MKQLNIVGIITYIGLKPSGNLVTFKNMIHKLKLII